MKRRPLGRTGLEVSVAGLGGGGPSRLGLGRGASRADALALVRQALDRGVTFIDTAPLYGNEDIVGEAIAHCRDRVVVATKATLTTSSPPGLVGATRLARDLDQSLARLGTDHVDVLLLHGVSVETYSHCVGELLPELRRLKSEGVIRCFGLSEAFEADPRHAMLTMAIEDGFWDCVMVGMSLVNPSARESVLPRAAEKGMGTLVMRAARDVLARLRPEDPQVALLADASYRFCAHSPGVDVVLTGTGALPHLDANLQSICGPPLDPDTEARLRDILRLGRE